MNKENVDERKVFDEFNDNFKLEATDVKRTDYINWDEYFMSIAALSAKRSKDPVTQVGACIVNDKNQIVGVGYNGMPRGLPDDEMPWGKDDADPLKNKYYYVVHAELNAVLNKNCVDLTDCRLYTTLFPCSECTKTIIQSGIKEVIYLSDQKRSDKPFQASRFMLDKAKVIMTQFDSARKSINLDLRSKL